MIWIFTFRQRTKSTNWHLKKALSSIKLISFIKEEPTFKNYNKSDLIYYTYHIFYKSYCDNKKFCHLSLKAKYSFLARFLNDIDKFNNLKPRNKNTKKKKQKCMIQLQNFIIHLYINISMNTMI